MHQREKTFTSRWRSNEGASDVRRSSILLPQCLKTQLKDVSAAADSGHGSLAMHFRVFITISETSRDSKEMLRGRSGEELRISSSAE